tara:strand:- start:192 stop:368 length:177 start_codon:yes stop_codon:yes gene_type:complete
MAKTANRKKLQINKKRISQTKQPGLVPMYGIKEVDGKKVRYIKYWYEPPGFMGNSKYS